MAFELVGIPPDHPDKIPVVLIDKHEGKNIESYELAERLKTFCEGVMDCKYVFIKPVIIFDDTPMHLAKDPFNFDSDDPFIQL